MTEKLVRAFNTNFGYTEKQVVAGIENIRSDLQRFRLELESGNEGMKDLARRLIPGLEKTLEYVDERTPAQMIEELRGIHNLITTLELGGASRQKIGEVLLDGHRDRILTYRPVFNSGWIETALQTITGEVTRRNM